MRFAPHAALATALLAALPAPALAWGEYAHRLTGAVAFAEAKPATKRAIRALLRQSAAVDTPSCPLRTLEDAAYWPDCVRSLGDRYAYAASWHYQNVSVCRDFDFAAACPDGNCVTAQIPRQLAVLKDRRAPLAKRIEALAFVTHFVGDMHQPVHIGDKGDRGANDVRADYGDKALPRMNLHRIWDTEMAERALTEPPMVTARVTRAERAAYRGGTVEAWARESWQASKDTAYGKLQNYPDRCLLPPAPTPPATPAPDAAVPGVTPGATPISDAFAAAMAGPRAHIDEPYIAAATPVVRAQAVKAGVRLAELLDAAFAAPAR
ncbi:S1/P1 nuclease [Glacieibacterium frigidum]|uniref:S1/P1 Nuclease n=1 Tax=Glacieibacterium frigidum TaxID=2593303 RepID=A0A552UIQ2_9SPHN|nr:S1/P1 nuclease [Glacieibacterium frigidum]TRW18087.1 hypothetical protein FMM06_08240 [Glacieibacterium frigidum]